MSDFLGNVTSAAAVKGARVLRAFGAEPSDKLLDIRTAKIDDELAELTKQGDRLVAEGLGEPGIIKTWMELRTKVIACDAITNNKKKDSELEKIKEEAREQVGKVTKEVSELLRKSKEIIAVQVAKAKYFMELAKVEAKKKDDDKTKRSWLISVKTQDGQRGIRLVLSAGIYALEENKKTDVKAAFGRWEGLAWGPVENETVGKYQSEVIGPPLIKKADDAAKADPNGPEAKLEKLFGRSSFEEKLRRMALMMEVFAKNDASFAEIFDNLGVGYALAIREYSTNYYQQVNDLLLGREVAVPGKDKEAAKGAIAMMSELTAKALSRLPRYTGGFTQRGESDWTGAKEQYKKGNIFKIPIFWSTGKDFAFPGLYQIEVRHNGGKNISAFSDHPLEAEVLFPPETEFKVIAKPVTTFDPHTSKPARISIIVDNVPGR